VGFGSQRGIERKGIDQEIVEVRLKIIPKIGGAGDVN
jgi:hypothetical protein